MTWAYPVRERKVLGQLKLTGEQIALTAARAADDKRGSGIVVLDLRDISLMTDYFVIVDASSEAQVRAITEGIQEALEAEGVAAYRREGWEDARWVLLDYGDAVVHIFRTEDREYYDLERLWGDAPRLILNETQEALVLETR